MNYSINNVSLLPAILISVAMTIGCASPAKKNVEAAEKFEKQGDQSVATDYYLQALSTEPKNEVAIQGLRRVLKGTYDQQISIIEALERDSRTEEAITKLQSLKDLINRAERFIRITFQVANFDERISKNRNIVATKLIEAAENDFKSRQFDSAVIKFNQAAALLPQQAGKINERISASFFEFAIDLQNQKKFREAAHKYMESGKTSPGYRDANLRAAIIFEKLADHHLSNKNCRNAESDYQRSKILNSANINLAQKLNDAYNCAAVRIAFLNFSDKGIIIAGTSVGENLTDSVMAKLQQEKSKFLSVYDRDQLQQVYSETALQALESGRIPAGGLTAAGPRSVDYIVYGRVTQALEREPRQNQSRRAGQYSVNIAVPYMDKGKQRERYELRYFPLSYSIISAQSYVKIQGSIKIVRVRDAYSFLAQQFTDEELDQIQFADNFSARHDLSNATIDSEITNLANARKQVLDTSVLSKKVIDRISAKLSSDILESVDSIPSLNDPPSLNLPF